MSKKKKMLITGAIVLLIWLKTYVVQKGFFNLPLENSIQSFILFINPLSSILIICGIGMLFSRVGLVLAMFFSSFILFANVIYYRFFNDFITLPVLFQTDNVSDMGSSFLELVQFKDLFIFSDVMVVLIYFLVRKEKVRDFFWSRKQSFTLVAAGVLTFILTLMVAETERSQLLTRSFDRELLVKNIGLLNYHVYDVVLQSKTKTQKAFADSSEVIEIENYASANHYEPNEDYFGAAKGRNLFVIKLESTQNFVVNETVNGEEITPFLNDLIDDSIHIENFYHQTGQGKTSDSEFLLANSLYPLPRGAVFFTHSQNKYNALPNLLKGEGYYSAVFHANNKSFWNRDIVYDNFGYDKYYSKPYYEITKENSIGWGIRDDHFFKQSMPYLEDLPEPFYAKFITLTNHFPFSLRKSNEIIHEWDSEDGTVNRYFTTVRYQDEALKLFFEDLKKKGLYENSMFMIYGDHYGISENHNEAMSRFLNKDITPLETTKLQKVPMVIHVPGQEPLTVKTVSGQIDLRPTITNLLGIEDNKSILFGSDMLSKEKESFAVLRNGSFITENVIWARGKCYNRETSKETNSIECEPYFEKAKNQLGYSDKVVYGDLLRFIDK